MIRLNFALLALVAPMSVATAQSGIELMDRHTWVHLRVNEFEVVDPGSDQTLAWDIDLSVGGDLHRFKTTIEGESVSGGENENELQILYSKAILPFWNLQGGVRRDLEPGPERDWAVVSVHGLAPYFFELEAELFFTEGGQSSLRAQAEYEILLTRKLILTPELELEAYGRNEQGRMIGSGLSEAAFDLRLRYEFKRELAPYLGFRWQRLYGNTRDFARLAGEPTRDNVFVVGLRAWF